MKIHRVSHSDLCIRRVVCINVNDEVGKKLHLTYGKTYDHIYYEEGIIPYIRIIDDTGKEFAYLKSYFTSLEKWREKQLKEIGL